MNRMTIRFLTIAISIVMIITMVSGCNNDAEVITHENGNVVPANSGATSLSEATAALSYQSKQFELPAELSGMSAYAFNGSTLYVSGQELRDDAEISSIYSICIDTGSVVRFDYYEPKTSAIIRSIGIDNEARLWVLESRSEYLNSAEGSIATSDETSQLLKFNQLGELEETVALDDSIRPSQILVHDNYVYMVCPITNMLVVLDTSGALLFEAGLNQYASLTAIDSGIAAYDGQGISMLNHEQQRFESIADFDESFRKISGNGNILFMDNGTHLYCYDIDSASGEMLFSWMSIGLYGSYLDLYTLPDNGILYCAYDGVNILSAHERNADEEIGIEADNNQNDLAISDMSGMEDIGGTLVLATFNADRIKNAVLAFNSLNGRYTIEIEDYSAYNANVNSSEGLTKLRTEIVAGNIPDIIDLSDIPSDMYDNNALLADLMPFLENDREFGVNDFEPAALSAMMTGGKLLNFTPEFSIFTVIGNSSDIAGNSINSFNDLIAITTQDGGFRSTLNRSLMIRYAIGSNNSKYYDFETGACYFDSREFVDFLEFLKILPEDPRSLREMIPSDSLRFMCLSVFGMPRGLRQYFTEDEIGFAGLPSSNDNKAIVIPQLSLGMTSESQRKIGVWEFMKFLVSDSYLLSNGVSGFSIKKTMNDYNVQEYRQWLATDGNFSYHDGNQVVNVKCDESDIELFNDMLSSVTGMFRHNEGLYNIVIEDSSAFFDGRITAERAAELIQSRASIYMSERR